MESEEGDKGCKLFPVWRVQIWVQYLAYLKTGSRPKGYGGVSWPQHMMCGWATLLHTAGRESWQGKEVVEIPSPTGSGRAGCWRWRTWAESDTSRGSNLTKAQVELGERQSNKTEREIIFSNRVELSDLTRLFRGESTNITRRRSQLLLITGWNCLVGVVIMV